MKFEYSAEKSKTNLTKHGISFEEASQLWLVVSVEIPARNSGEDRFMIIGKLGGKFYSCVFTVRNEVIRLISARRSRKKEEKIYHEKNKEADYS